MTLLNPDDRIDYSITVELKKQGTSIWVKLGAQTKILPEENGRLGLRRLRRFVEGELDKITSEIVSS